VALVPTVPIGIAWGQFSALVAGAVTTAVFFGLAAMALKIEKGGRLPPLAAALVTPVVVPVISVGFYLVALLGIRHKADKE